MLEKAQVSLSKIGYLYYYPRLDQAYDKFRLDIFLSEIHAAGYFDILRAHFFGIAPGESIEYHSIAHPWYYEKNLSISAGTLSMDIRNGKKEEAFTFGGKLKIDTQESHTICTFVSNAPILEISGSSPVHRLFIEELEIILAECKAASENLHAYESRLCKIDPFELYLACLRKLVSKFEDFPYKSEEYHQLMIFLHSQEHRLKEADLVLAPVPRLEDLFK